MCMEGKGAAHRGLGSRYSGKLDLNYKRKMQIGPKFEQSKNKKCLGCMFTKSSRV